MISLFWFYQQVPSSPEEKKKGTGLNEDITSCLVLVGWLSMLRSGKGLEPLEYNISTAGG